VDGLMIGGKAAAEELKRQLGQVLELNNPSVDQQAEQRRPARVPMSTQQLRLKVPDMPGYKLHWFREDNVPAAIDAYYEFVKRDEIRSNPIGIGTNAMDGGNTDLGTNVSLVAGQNAAGQPIRLILMKLKLEYAQEDERLLAQRNQVPMEAIFGDEAMMFSKDGKIIDKDPLAYRKTALFNRPVRKTKPDQMRSLKKRLEALEKAVRGNSE
jgi:hypothetical protein